MNLQTKTQQEVSRQPLTIDTIVFCQGESDLQKLEATAFPFFRFHNVLEFKSSVDKLTIPGYHRILARSRLYLSENPKLSLDDITLCIISSSKPRSVLSRIPQITFTRIEKGHYVADELIPTHIYVLSELPIEERYYRSPKFTLLEPVPRIGNNPNWHLVPASLRTASLRRGKSYILSTGVTSDGTRRSES